jgi:hypothetical protein
VSADSWRGYAACAELAEPDVMYPEASDKIGLEAARAVCAACPVKRECLDEALAEEGGRTKDSRFGVRAGRTPSQRFGIYQSRRPSSQTETKPRGPGRSKSGCGTAAAYERHCRFGEPIDDSCRAAHNEKSRRHRARQRAAREEAAA